jgi:hypothetical protein
MPRKKPKLIVAAHRVAEATRIVAEQHQLIAKLKAFRRPTLDAERTLQMYVGSLKDLEDYERKLEWKTKPKRAKPCRNEARRRSTVPIAGQNTKSSRSKPHRQQRT